MLLLGIGLVVKYAKDTIMDVVSLLPTKDQLVDDALNSSSLLNKAAIAFMVIGAFILIVSIIGCKGALGNEEAHALVLVSGDSFLHCYNCVHST